MARGEIPDLGAVPQELPPELRAEALEEGEVQAGLRCGGCRRRVSHGFLLQGVEAAFIPGQGGVINVTTATACSDPECGFFVAQIEAGAVAVTEVRRRFLDEGPEGEALRALLRGPQPRVPDPDRGERT